MAPSDALPDDASELLDERYEIVRELGEGGMGRVFEGLHVILRRKVAIKVLSHRMASDARSRKRLLREARAAAAIRHPSVVETIDFGETKHGSVFLVMELLEGRDLRAIVREQGALPWPRVHNILRQAASALQAAHELGIIHRDIKPHNCFVCDLKEDQSVETIKLLDFGIAKVEDTSDTNTGLTGTGEIVGTATYMAPELTFGATAGVPTDLYSLGVMAYELLTGAPPFSGKNVYEIMRCHIEDAPVPLREHLADIPAPLEAVVLRAMAKKPEERFASMAAMEAALAAVPVPSRIPASTRDSQGKPVAEPIGPTGTEIMTVNVGDSDLQEAPTELMRTELMDPGQAPVPGPSSRGPGIPVASAAPPPPGPMASSSASPAEPRPAASDGGKSLWLVAAVLAIVAVLAAAAALWAWLG